MSEAGPHGSAAGAACTASKHGVVGLTGNLAVMYRKQGVRANAIAPGGTATDIAVNAEPAGHGPAALGPRFVDLGRPARPEERAAAVPFLASDAASDISGAVLPVDDGWSAV